MSAEVTPGSESLMLQEALGAAQCLRTQWASTEEQLHKLGLRLREQPPAFAVTVARGSSDHAASYLAYLIMARRGCIAASLPMSLVTLYQAPLQARDTLAIAVSQSGQSPDVVAPMRYFREAQATTVALVNDETSPLAQAVQWTVPLRAGEERSVAATKSFIASLAAGARLVAHWGADARALSALQSLPDRLDAACEEAIHPSGERSSWEVVLEALVEARRLMVVGRGPGLALAQEAALKFKETSALQAEAFSGAEIQHGPMALVERGYPLLIFALRGPAQSGLVQLATAMRQRGARVLLAAPPEVPQRDWTLPVADDPDLDPVVAIQAFYVLAERLARLRGFNPDVPRHLNKVTRTQ